MNIFGRIALDLVCQQNRFYNAYSVALSLLCVLAQEIESNSMLNEIGKANR